MKKLIFSVCGALAFAGAGVQAETAQVRPVTQQDCYAARDLLVRRYGNVTNGVGITASPRFRACAVSVMFETEAQRQWFANSQLRRGESPYWVGVRGAQVELVTEVVGKIVPYPSASVSN